MNAHFLSIHVYMCSQVLVLVPLCFICCTNSLWNLKNQRFTISSKQTCETIRMLWIMLSSIKPGRRKSRFLIEEFVQRLVFVQEIQSKPKIFIKTDLAPKTSGCLFLYRKNMISDRGQDRNDICCKTGTFLRLKLPLWAVIWFLILF